MADWAVLHLLDVIAQTRGLSSSAGRAEARQRQELAPPLEIFVMPSLITLRSFPRSWRRPRIAFRQAFRCRSDAVRQPLAIFAKEDFPESFPREV